MLAAAASTTQPISGEGIQTRQVMQTVEIDHSWDAMYAEADEVFKLWKSNGLEAGTEKAKEYGFSSVYQARAIRTRSQKPKTDSMELNVFSIGDIGFTAGTYEMFSESGAYVKENSPFAVTFLITGNSGYIATAEAHDYQCYEAVTGYFVKGTAEILAEKYVEMLKEIG